MPKIPLATPGRGGRDTAARKPRGRAPSEETHLRREARASFARCLGPAVRVRSPSRSVRNKYLLGPAFLTEADITRARAGPSPTVTWTVAYELTTNGADALAAETNRLLDVPGPANLIAIVVNGVVVSAANVQTVIASGEGTIIGNFDEDRARSLAAELRPSSS